MNDDKRPDEYQSYVESKSLQDLFSIEIDIDKKQYPERYEILINEIKKRQEQGDEELSSISKKEKS